MPTYIVASTKDPVAFQTNKIAQDLRDSSGITFKNQNNDFEKAKIIIAYVHELFPHDSYAKPSHPDPLTILEEAKAGKSFRCVEFSILSAALLAAFGIAARVMGMKADEAANPEAAGGHVIVEFFEPVSEKWAASDAQWGVIAGDKDNLLSVTDLARMLPGGSTPDVVSVTSKIVDSREYYEWLSPYLFFFEEFRQEKLH